MQKFQNTVKKNRKESRKIRKITQNRPQKPKKSAQGTILDQKSPHKISPGTSTRIYSLRGTRRGIIKGAKSKI